MLQFCSNTQSIPPLRPELDVSIVAHAFANIVESITEQITEFGHYTIVFGAALVEHEVRPIACSTGP